MWEYGLQEPLLHAFSADTLTVVLPDDNFTFFGFHAKINENIESLETGTINEEINEMNEDKKWIVDIKNTTLSEGDIVYYWIHVIKNGKEYHKTGSWKVIIVEIVQKMRSFETLLGKYVENHDGIKAASTPPSTSEVKTNEATVIIIES